MIHLIVEASKGFAPLNQINQISYAIVGCLAAKQIVKAPIKARIIETSLLRDELDGRHVLHATIKATSRELNFRDLSTLKTIGESIKVVADTLKIGTSLPLISVEMIELVNYFET